MASLLTRIFGGSRPNQQPQPAMIRSPEEEKFDQVYGELVEYIAQNMGHGWIEDNRNRLGGIAEYVRAENTASVVVSAIRTQQGDYSKNRFEDAAWAAEFTLMVLQNTEHPEHERVRDFVLYCQRTDMPMADANKKAMINFLRCDYAV